MAEQNTSDPLASLRQIKQTQGDEAYSRAWRQLSRKERSEVLNVLDSEHNEALNPPKIGGQVPIGAASYKGFNINEYVNGKVGKIIGVFLLLMILGGIVMTWTIGIAIAGLLQGNGWALLMPVGVSSVIAIITVFVLLSWLLSTILHGVRAIVEETTLSLLPPRLKPQGLS